MKKKACGFLRVRSPPSDFQLPKLDQLDNRLRATFDIQLLHDVGNVITDGFLTNKQLPGNVARRFILHEKFKDLPFTMS